MFKINSILNDHKMQKSSELKCLEQERKINLIYIINVETYESGVCGHKLTVIQVY